jgi:nucleoside-diphosphate-sugar epimerase
MPKKILITGGTVFVGKAAAEYFVSSGYEVYVLNRNTKPQVSGVHLIEADRHALSSVLKGHHFDAVLDICAYTASDVNDLLDALESFDTYILISSSAVYPETAVQPFLEEMPAGKNAWWKQYGLNKIEAENCLLERVPDAYILRPAYIYGPYDLVYREAFVFECALKNRFFALPEDGSLQLQFIHVFDLARFMQILVEQKPEEHVFNMANPQTISAKEWVQMCYKATGKEARFVQFHQKPYMDYFPFAEYEYKLDVTKQMQLMPDLCDMQKGLQEAFGWYKEHTNLIRKKDYIQTIDKKLSCLK